MSDMSAIPVARPATARDYMLLLKPRIMMLVAFTALAGLVTAQGLTGTTMDPAMAVIVILAVALGSGAGGAINMWYDADIDAVMPRTAMRPVPQGVVPAGEALATGLILAVCAVLLIWMASTLLAAMLLGLAIVYYGWFYTIVLKRRTPQNIVIGGAAGAFPPVVGWAAVTGTAPLDAWLLFAIIFFWTPPHFWSLALVTHKEYAKADIPMLPVTHGPAVTRRQIFVYTLVLTPIGLSPLVTGMGGLAYALAGGILTVVFLCLAFRVFRSQAGDSGTGEMAGRPAMQLFVFSILYLFGLFAVLILEHGLALHVPVSIGGMP